MGGETEKALAKRHRLFGIGARAVAIYCRTEEDLYVCPVCGGAFPREAADDGTLSLEHVPPRSSGGRPLVLTCRRCNSEAGETIDSAAARREDMEAAIGIVVGRQEERVPRRALMTVGGRTIPVEISRLEGTTQLRPVAAASQPAALQHVIDFFREHAQRDTGDGAEFTITVSRRAFGRLSMISDLKTGFLAAFAFLGYGFALHSSLTAVRRQIREPHLDIVGTRFHVSFTGAALPLTLVAATEPYPCIAAILRDRGVLMPMPGSHSNLYDTLLDHDARGVSLRGTRLGWPTTMELRLDQLRGASGEG